MNSQQRQSADYAQEPGKKRKWFSQRRLLILTVLLVAGVIAIIWILSTLSIIPNTWSLISYLVVTIIVAVLGSFESLHLFASSHQNEPRTHSEHLPYVSVLNPQILPIIIPLPITQPLITQSSQPNKTAYREIISLPPLTDPRTIEQREADVIEVYEKVTQPGTTAIVLTGIAGVGKSTLAALVYHYAEEQRHAGNGIFTTQVLWLNIDPAATMADLAGTLFEKLNKTLPDFSNLDSLRQAAELFEALNTSDEVRLVILDQFENLLAWDSGHALADRPGIGEWLDAINNQACKCRLLITSRVWPQGSHAYPPTYMQESQVHGLETDEGVELLRKQGVGVKQATETELVEAVIRCDGHALALVLLASILNHNRSLSLHSLLYNPVYSQLWIGDIAHNLLDLIYMKQMSDMQRKLLLAFSIYREPVPLEAALAVIDFGDEAPEKHLLEALQVLIAQHLLQATGEERYQLHPLITFYAEGHFDESSEQANLQILHGTHARAAQYYQRQAALGCPPRNKRQHSTDIRPFIESIWQYCQGEHWQEAYDLLKHEEIFADLNRWGENAILLELYQQMLPSDKWRPQNLLAMDIYHKLGVINTELKKKEEARQYFEKALSISRELADQKEECKLLNQLGIVYADLRLMKSALEYLEQALIIERAAQDYESEGITLYNLGIVYSIQGQREQALEYYNMALSVHKNISNHQGEGRILNSLGRVYYALGQKEQAWQCYIQALRIRIEIGDQKGVASTLINIGIFYFERGNFEAALASWKLARSIFEEAQSLSFEITQNWMDTLLEKIGAEQFAALSAKIETQASQIIEQALREPIE